MRPVLIPLPECGFDPSEAAVPWWALKRAGIPVVFATPKEGVAARADPLMVTGEGLDVWGCVPLLKHLKLVGLLLRANRQARNAYTELLDDPAFLHPISYEQVQVGDFSGLLLPGGHCKAMRDYLESSSLQDIVRAFLAEEGPAEHRPIAAICHGVLVLARTQAKNGRSVLHGRRVTALTWSLENTAWQIARNTRFWEPDYYRTYPETTEEPPGFRSTEAEIKRALARAEDFLDVSPDTEYYSLKTDGLHRDSPDDSRAAWVVQDGNLITARWPGDVNLFAKHFIAAVQQRGASKSAHPH